MNNICGCAVAASSRMLIGGLSAILRKRKGQQEKKEKINIKNKKKKTTIEGEKFKTNRKEERKLHMHRAGQFRRQRCRSCHAFLTFLAVLVCQNPILRWQPKFYWDIFILVSTGSSRATVRAHGALRKAIDCQPPNFEGLPGQLHNFFPKKKTQWSFEKFKNRQKEKDSCRKKRQESWKRWQTMSELHCFLTL